MSKHAALCPQSTLIWQIGVSSVNACVTNYLRKECGDLNEEVSDNDDGKDDDDDDDANSKDIEVVEIGTTNNA